MSAVNMNSGEPTTWNSQQLAQFLISHHVTSSVIQSGLNQQVDGCQFAKEPLACLHSLGIDNKNLTDIIINDWNEIISHGYSSSYINRRLVMFENDLTGVSLSSSSSIDNLHTNARSPNNHTKQSSNDIETSIDNLQQTIEHASVQRDYLHVQHEKSLTETNQISTLYDQIHFLEEKLLKSNEKYGILQSQYDEMDVLPITVKTETETQTNSTINIENSMQTEAEFSVSHSHQESQTNATIMCDALTDTFDLTDSDPTLKTVKKTPLKDADTQVDIECQPAESEKLESIKEHELEIQSLELQTLLTNEQKETRQLRKKIKEQEKKSLQIQNDFRLQTQDLVTEVQILTDELATLRSERSNLRHSLSFSNDNLQVVKVAMASEASELKQEVSTWRLTAESLTQQLKEAKEELENTKQSFLVKPSTFTGQFLNAEYQQQIFLEREQFQATLQKEIEIIRENDRLKEATYQANIDHLTKTIHDLTTVYTSLMAAVTSGLATNSPILGNDHHRNTSPPERQQHQENHEVRQEEEGAGVKRQLFSQLENHSRKSKPPQQHWTKKYELVRIYDPTSFSAPASPESNLKSSKPRSSSSCRRPSTSAPSTSSHPNKRNALVLSTIHSKVSSPVGDLLEKLRQRYGDVAQLVEQQQLQGGVGEVRLTQPWPVLRIKTAEPATSTTNEDNLFVPHAHHYAQQPEAPSRSSRPSTANSNSRGGISRGMKINTKSSSETAGEVPRYMSPKADDAARSS